MLGKRKSCGGEPFFVMAFGTIAPRGPLCKHTPVVILMAVQAAGKFQVTTGGTRLMATLASQVRMLAL